MFGWTCITGAHVLQVDYDLGGNVLWEDMSCLKGECV